MNFRFYQKEKWVPVNSLSLMHTLTPDETSVLCLSILSASHLSPESVLYLFVQLKAKGKEREFIHQNMGMIEATIFSSPTCQEVIGLSFIPSLLSLSEDTKKAYDSNVVKSLKHIEEGNPSERKKDLLFLE